MLGCHFAQCLGLFLGVAHTFVHQAYALLDVASQQRSLRFRTGAGALAQSDEDMGALATEQFSAAWPRQPGMNKSMLERWYSPQCVRHFDKDAAMSAEGAWPRTLPRRTTREDLCQGGRAASVWPQHRAQDIVIVKELKMVYIENRKAASSSIRHLLSKYFHSNWKWSCRGAPEACRIIDNRCSSECLSADQLQDYFFFTFVRDPLDRFYSGLKEGLVMWNSHHIDGEGKANLTSAECMGPLDALLNRSCGVDHHLESQATALSTHLPLAEDGRDFELHYDYIGRTERLADDMAIVLEEAQHKAGTRQAESTVQDLVAELRDTHDNQGEALLQTVLTVRDEAMDHKVREVYSQDFACFVE